MHKIINFFKTCYIVFLEVRQLKADYTAKKYSKL